MTTQHTSGPRRRPLQHTTTPERPPLEGVFNLLIPALQRAVSTAGYTTPTPIQEQSIPHLLDGRDLLGSAQTGTGKTAAFTLPLLQALAANRGRPQPFHPRALILAPTRELAAQIADSIEDYGRFLRLSFTVVFGGVSQERQVRAMRRGVDILVATPGRLLDLMQQGYIKLNQVNFFILDEVDRMLDMGFQPDIKRVMAEVPHERQTLFFSATLPPDIMQLANSMVTNPVRITIEPDKPAVERIQQKVLFVGRGNKNALLVSLLENPEMRKVIVFTQMKHVANRVVDKLEQAGLSGTAIHGNKSQGARTKALDGFKRGRYRVLVATDVAARGLDVDDITHVINYDLPMEAETYIHRIGRTARAGAEGKAISFCSADERALLRDIEKLLGNMVPFEREHRFHCEDSYRSTLPAARPYGNGGSRGRNPGAKRKATGDRPLRRQGRSRH